MNAGVHSDVERSVHPKFDKRLFSRIREILAARLVRGQLVLEIYVSGAMPPKEWFHGLRCEVRDPAKGTVQAYGEIIEAELRSEGHVIAYTAPLRGGPDVREIRLTKESMVRLVTTNGLSIEHLLRKLLLAKP